MNSVLDSSSPLPQRDAARTSSRASLRPLGEVFPGFGTALANICGDEERRKQVKAILKTAAEGINNGLSGKQISRSVQRTNPEAKQFFADKQVWFESYGIISEEPEKLSKLANDFDLLVDSDNSAPVIRLTEALINYTRSEIFQQFAFSALAPLAIVEIKEIKTIIAGQMLPKLPDIPHDENIPVGLLLESALACRNAFDFTRRVGASHGPLARLSRTFNFEELFREIDQLFRKHTDQSPLLAPILRAIGEGRYKADKSLSSELAILTDNWRKAPTVFSRINTRRQSYRAVQDSPIFKTSDVFTKFELLVCCQFFLKHPSMNPEMNMPLIGELLRKFKEELLKHPVSEPVQKTYTRAFILSRFFGMTR